MVCLLRGGGGNDILIHFFVDTGLALVGRQQSYFFILLYTSIAVLGKPSPTIKKSILIRGQVDVSHS